MFDTTHWRPKEPLSYAKINADDVYFWASVVQQHFVFMDGSPKQEVAFVPTLLNGAAHKQYLGCEWPNGNKPPLD